MGGAFVFSAVSSTALDSMACRRFLYGLARFGPFECRCLFSNDLDFTADSPDCWTRRVVGRSVNEMAVTRTAAFMMTLSVEDLSNILMESHMSLRERWLFSRVTLKPDLWRLANLVRRLSENRSLFSTLDELCGEDPLECSYAFFHNCERPLRVSTFVAVLGWLAGKCRVEVDGRFSKECTEATCEAVACVISPCLLYLC